MAADRAVVIVEPGVAEAARLMPDKVALRTPAGDRMTFRELDELSNQVARTLAAAGVARGAFVGSALRNRLEYFVVLQATWRLGAILVPVPYRATGDEVQYYIDDSGMAVLVAEDDSPSAGVDRRVHGLSQILADSKGRSTDPVRPDGPMPELVFPYTSGTTGRPKGVHYPGTEHGFFDPRPVLTQMLEVFGIREPSNVHLCVAPLSHAQPRAYSQAALDSGHTVVVVAGFDARQALELVEEAGVTWMSAAPIHLQRILALGDEVIKGFDLSSMRLLLHSAAPIAPELKLRVMDLFPDAVWEIYGGSEGSFAAISPAEYRARPGSVGRAFPGRVVEIRDVDGSLLPAGEVGLIYVGSSTAEPLPRFEYVGSPDATSSAWLGDRFTIGDVGYLDEDGYLFLTDRAKDMIVSGGVNIYSAEVEHALSTHPLVADVAVFGVPDAEFGEAVKAVVEPASPAPVSEHAAIAAELAGWCHDRLTDYKCPATIDIVDALPRDATGKLRKRDLRAPYWAGHDHQLR